MSLMLIHRTIFVTLFILSSVQYSEQAACLDEKTAFSNDIQACLLTSWTGTTDTSVLSSEYACNDDGRVGLCYGRDHLKPQFVVCYNTGTLIPEFSAYIVPKEPAEKGGRENEWRNEAGRYAPHPQSDVLEDYDPCKQNMRFPIPNYNQQRQFFCSRGHLTPNADFVTAAERLLAMVNTNIAPQWQLFNQDNWATLEKAVKSYAVAPFTGRDKDKVKIVYVFTGTGGEAKITPADPKIELNGRVLAPKYYWKIVCVPAKRESIVFIADNPIGKNDLNDKEAGCAFRNAKPQTRAKGIIRCYGFDEFKLREEASSLNLPPLSAVNCGTGRRGMFLDQSLNGLK